MSQDDHFKNLHISEGVIAFADLDDINCPPDTKEDIENLLSPVNSPSWRKDPMGTYIIFSTLDGSAQKYDANVIGNKIRTMLNKLEALQRC